MFNLPDLPFEYSALEPFIDEETMRVHHDGHHATYVKNLNEALEGQTELLNMDIKDLLKSLDQVPEDIRTKVKNNAGGHFHHSFLWTILGSGEKEQPEGKLSEKISSVYGDFEKFKEEFKNSALKVFGSGYTWLVVNEKGNLEITNTPNQDSPISVGQIPIFTIDVWEHAYYLKYKNKRADYIDAFWNVINWEKVEEYFNQTS
ncbi:MAG: superoxide dismutase [Candidatus Daviesbacteria bacterium]|nr:superoxide dismutase [Candidatus Daviesbacteria bacterium]